MQDGFSPKLFLKTPLWHLHDFSLGAQYEVDDLANGVRYGFAFRKVDSRSIRKTLSCIPLYRAKNIMDVLDFKKQYEFGYNIGL